MVTEANNGYWTDNEKQVFVIMASSSGVLKAGFKPLPEILKALQNCAELNPIAKTVKNCWI